MRVLASSASRSSGVSSATICDMDSIEFDALLDVGGVDADFAAQQVLDDVMNDDENDDGIPDGNVNSPSDYVVPTKGDATSKRPSELSEDGQSDSSGDESEESTDEEKEASPARENQFVVEKILGERRVKGRMKYQIKWLGFPDTENSWEDEADVQCYELIAEFHEVRGIRKPSGKNRKQKTVDDQASDVEPKQPTAKKQLAARKSLIGRPPQPSKSPAVPRASTPHPYRKRPLPPGDAAKNEDELAVQALEIATRELSPEKEQPKRAKRGSDRKSEPEKSSRTPKKSVVATARRKSLRTASSPVDSNQSSSISGEGGPNVARNTSTPAEDNSPQIVVDASVGNGDCSFNNGLMFKEVAQMSTVATGVPPLPISLQRVNSAIVPPVDRPVVVNKAVVPLDAVPSTVAMNNVGKELLVFIIRDGNCDGTIRLKYTMRDLPNTDGLLKYDACRRLFPDEHVNVLFHLRPSKHDRELYVIFQADPPTVCWALPKLIMRSHYVKTMGLIEAMGLQGAYASVRQVQPENGNGTNGI